MALTKKMTPTEMVSFIDKELLPQTQEEIQNLIHPKKKQGGYFVVTRQILCMTDFLGAVYSGYPRSERKRDEKEKKERISTTKKAKRFIAAFFKPKSTYRRDTVNKLYDMYRHGLVHLYQPRTLQYKKGSLEWFVYKGKRYQAKMIVSTNKGEIIIKDVDHLKIIQFAPDKNRYHLAICIDALYDDFKQATIDYKNKLVQAKHLQSNWRATVDAICKPR